MSEPTLRDRAVLAACALHSKGTRGSATTPCEVGRRTADAVLAEVRRWLLEMADGRDADATRHGASPAALIAAGDAGVLRGLADRVSPAEEVPDAA